MKTRLTLIIAILITISSLAQQGINYKALIKDASENVIANQSITIRFSILQGTTQINVYQETHNPTTDVNGIVIANIGEGTVVSGDFDSIDWGSEDHFLNVQINTGSGLIDMGTTQFMAVPYALYAKDVEGAITELNDLEDARTIDGANGDALYIGINSGLADNIEYSRNVGIGDGALEANTTGYSNTAIGYHTLNRNIDGYNNSAFGWTALSTNVSGNSNTASGFKALLLNTTGDENVANGSEALFNNTTGYFNTANGATALYSNTTGFANTANGYGALYSNTIGTYNTAIGNYALYFNSAGEDNTAVGRRAPYNNTDGGANTAIGFHSLYNNTVGGTNTAIGKNSLYSNTGGDANTAIGFNSLEGNTNGFENTAIGKYALSTTTTSRNNIGIGYDARASSPTVWNEVTLGNSNNNAYRMYAASWTNASDRNLKHNIEDIPVGLNFILQLRPVQFVYNNAKKEQKTLGFIAQEVKQVVKKNVLKEHTLVSPLDKDYLGLRTTELIAVLTKAIQEQQKMINDLQSKLENKNSAFNDLGARVKENERLLHQKKYTEVTNNNI